MEAIGLAGLVLSATQIVLTAPQEAHRSSLSIITWLRKDIEDHGFVPAVVVRVYQPEAWAVILRVHKHVLKAEDQHREALSFKKSHIASYNMVGITGAIVAQIAITALSLPNLEDTHWTAAASFVVSIIAGCLAVYAACIMQISLAELHDGAAIFKWLQSKSPPESDVDKFLYGPETSISISAALMLAAPVTLLHWALSTLLIGLGIYYGFIYGRNLGNLQGKDANLAVLLCFVLFTLTFIGIFFVPWGWNVFDRTIRSMPKHSIKQKLHDEENESDAVAGAQTDVDGASPNALNTGIPQPYQSPSQQVHGVPTPTERPDLNRIALQTFVASQMASLRDLETLIQSYTQAQAGQE